MTLIQTRDGDNNVKAVGPNNPVPVTVLPGEGPGSDVVIDTTITTDEATGKVSSIVEEYADGHTVTNNFTYETA